MSISTGYARKCMVSLIEINKKNCYDSGILTLINMREINILLMMKIVAENITLFARTMLIQKHSTNFMQPIYFPCRQVNGTAKANIVVSDFNFKTQIYLIFWRVVA